MATIVKGATFSNAATAGGMHALVESATISEIDRASADTSTISFATRSSSALEGPYSREVWQSSPSHGLASYDSANTRWEGALPSVVRYLNPTGGSAITAGMALVPTSGVDAALTVLLLTPCTSTSDKVIAVALADCAAGSQSVAVVFGPVKVACTGTVNSGEGVTPSATTGLVQTSGTIGSGWTVTTAGVAISASSGGFVWIHLRR